jgi:uncharacterized DUF497 family protein
MSGERPYACGDYAIGVVSDVVEYHFDPSKDMVNRAKHGVSLALAEVLFAGPHLTIEDDRFDCGEMRRIAFGHIRGRLFVSRLCRSGLDPKDHLVAQGQFSRGEALWRKSSARPQPRRWRRRIGVS